MLSPSTARNPPGKQRTAFATLQSNITPIANGGKSGKFGVPEFAAPANVSVASDSFRTRAMVFSETVSTSSPSSLGSSSEDGAIILQGSAEALSSQQSLAPSDMAKESLESLASENSATIALSTIDPLVDISGIPDMLVVEVKFPDVPALPPVSSMSHVDCVREIAAVYCMREAETAAALIASEGSSSDSPSSSFFSPGAGKNVDASIKGTVEVFTRGSKRSRDSMESSPGLMSPGQLDADVETDDADFAASGFGRSSGVQEQQGTCARTGGLSSPEIHALQVTDSGVDGSGAFLPEQWLCMRKGVIVRAAAGRLPTEITTMPASQVATTATPTIRLVISVPSYLHATTLAFDVPRSSMKAGAPLVGAAPGKDALTTLRAILAAAVPSSSSAPGIVELPGHLEGPEELQARISRALSLLSANVRPWLHAGLSPAESEKRIQQLVDRVKETTGYDVTPPMAPLAQTRLGSAHASIAAKNKSVGGTATGSGDSHTLGLASPAFKRYFASKPSTPTSLTSPTAGILSSATATPAVGRSVAKMGGRGSSIKLLHPGAAAHHGLAFSVTAKALFHSPSVPRGPASAVRGKSFASFGGFGPFSLGSALKGGRLSARERQFLASPQLIETAPQCSLTPERSKYKALARYVSSRDVSRPGASPAELDREYHGRILGTMQGGLSAMSEQRRSEEAHMQQVTQVKPMKDQRGGYMYIDLQTGNKIDPHTYETLYMQEVHYASEFVTRQFELNIEQSRGEEEALRAELRESDPACYAVLVARAQRAKANRLSWWDQDVEEGFALESSVYINHGMGSGETSTVGALLHEGVLGWIRAVHEAREGAVMAAMAAAEAEAAKGVQDPEEGSMDAADRSPADENRIVHSSFFGSTTGSTSTSSVSSVVLDAALLNGIRIALPTLLVPFETVLAQAGPEHAEALQAAHDSARVQLEANLLASLKGYAYTMGIPVEGGQASMGATGSDHFQAGLQGGEDITFPVVDTDGLVPSTLSFTFDPALGFTLSNSQTGSMPRGYMSGFSYLPAQADAQEEAEQDGMDGAEEAGSGSSGDSDIILSEAIRSFAGLALGEACTGVGGGGMESLFQASADSTGYGEGGSSYGARLSSGPSLAESAAHHAASASSALSGILLQLLPSSSSSRHVTGTTGGAMQGRAEGTEQGFPVTRLFGKEQQEEDSSCSSSTAGSVLPTGDQDQGQQEEAEFEEGELCEELAGECGEELLIRQAAAAAASASLDKTVELGILAPESSAVQQLGQGSSSAEDESEEAQEEDEEKQAAVPLSVHALASAGGFGTAFSEVISNLLGGAGGMVGVPVRLAPPASASLLSSFTTLAAKPDSPVTVPLDDDTHSGMPLPLSLPGEEAAVAKGEVAEQEAPPPASPSRIAPTMARVFSPQAHAQTPTRSTALAAPGTDARVKAARATLSFPNLPPLPTASTARGSSGAESLEASQMQGRQSFSLRAAEALKMFDAAVNGAGAPAATAPISISTSSRAALQGSVVSDARALVKAAARSPTALAPAPVRASPPHAAPAGIASPAGQASKRMAPRPLPLPLGGGGLMEQQQQQHYEGFASTSMGLGMYKGLLQAPSSSSLVLPLSARSRVSSSSSSGTGTGAAASAGHGLLAGLISPVKLLPLPSATTATSSTAASYASFSGL